ncbi:sensor histidine kinase [Selenihalanaerobacter shriftii]|uniref:histidine kinase n=1 Tax=Selenihalanaerobacter shriftii TaxID=142842 RepID=A0A1T4KQS3_9FIRM|nr:sensor histidine kinase [Selenihalanaerobacter shriftii]SJZ44733.1 two-component system, NarL family, sensor histidine kinase DegS [Selenihalanaerobacter shriftii]
MELDITSLDGIVDKMLSEIKNSQNEVFEIAEVARKEYEAAKEKLQEIRDETSETIQRVDELVSTNQRARQRLVKVSQDLNNYSESAIKDAYEKAKDTQVELSLCQEKEKRLRKRRDELERRIKELKTTVERAENLVSQIGIVKEFLNNDLQQFSSQIENLKQKEQLGIKIIEAQEEERKRVAREIHDGPAQSLANVVFRLEYSEKLLDKDIEKAKTELNDLKDLVRKSLQDVRKIIFDLRPMTLDDLGLIPTLKKYINDFINKTSLDVQLKVISNNTKLKSSYEVAVYRIIQEALNNANKHANAKRVDVKLELKSKLINVVINDDGSGFDVEQTLENATESDSFGLLSMKERAELLRGNLKFHSTLGKGTKIILKIPL